MSKAIGAYLISVVASVMLLSLIQSLLPKGTVKKVAGFVGGLLVVLAVLSPAVKIEPEQLLRYAAEFRRETRDITGKIETGNEELMARIIKEQCQSYILDKASQRGLDVKVEVILGKEGGYPCPVAVSLTGTVTPAERSWLTKEIARDMGIPANRQEWRAR